MSPGAEGTKLKLMRKETLILAKIINKAQYVLRMFGKFANPIYVLIKIGIRFPHCDGETDSLKQMEFNFSRMRLVTQRL